MPQVSVPTPPEGLFQFLNRVLKKVLRSPLHSPISKRLVLLTFTGRRSGRSFTIPVGYSIEDGQVVLMNDTGWWRNLVERPEVVLRLRGQDVRGRAEVISDPAAVAAYLRRRLERDGVASARTMGFRVTGDGIPSETEITSGLPQRAVIRVTPDQPLPAPPDPDVARTASP